MFFFENLTLLFSLKLKTHTQNILEIGRQKFEFKFYNKNVGYINFDGLSIKFYIAKLLYNV